MEVAILGPLEVCDGDRPVEIAGIRLRRLLIRLALDAGAPVAATQLVDAVWGDDLPTDEANALQSLVSRLRRALGASTLVQQAPTGYRLALDPDDVDAHRFERLAGEGASALREGDAERAADVLRDALGLWRGVPVADAEDSRFAAIPAARLVSRRQAATADRIDADIATGRSPSVLGELETLVGEHPLDERLAGLQIRALHASGQQADALSAFQRIRRQLVDELGVEPSVALRGIHAAALRHEPSELPAEISAARRTNLRAQLTSFVGRDEELGRIVALLESSRLVTVVGPGGAGKTRLATEAAATLLDARPDGIWVVELAPVTDPAEVAHAVLAAVSRRESALLGDRLTPRPPRQALAQLVESLGTRRVLLLIDNCEHLVDAVAALADTLLARCPQLTVLATSREPLGITGEAVVLIPPLHSPDAGATLAPAMATSGVRLFADRAADAHAAFAVDETTVGYVVEIVRRLDGLPLAIELAAARLRTLPIAEIAARLSDRFRLLTGGARTALPRHRTLRAVVQWSWDLLSPAERLLAERLAVFPAGATVASASAVCGDGVLGEVDVVDLLSALVDKSLVQLDDAAPDGAPRYRMLETIREFGTDLMAERDELAAVRLAHARYFAELAGRLDPALRGRGQIAALRRLDAEHDNLLAALRVLCDAGDATRAATLALNLSWYWMLADRHAEAATWLELVIALPAPVGSSLALATRGVRALNAVAAAMFRGTDADPRAEMHEIADQLIADGSDTSPLLSVVPAMLLFFAGDEPASIVAMERAVASADPWVRAMGLGLRARLAENRAEAGQMTADATAAYSAFEDLGDEWGMASVLPMLAGVRVQRGDLDGALELMERARHLLARLGQADVDDQLFLSLQMADLHVRRGDPVSARAMADAARRSTDDNGALEMRAITSAISSSIERHLGDLDAAHRLLREAEAQLPATSRPAFGLGHGTAVVLATGALLDLHEGLVDAARGRLGSGYTVARAAQDMPIVSIVAVAVAALALGIDRPVDAERLLGAAARLRGNDDPTALDVRRIDAAARAAVGETAARAAWQQGWQLTVEQALDAVDPALLVAGEPVAATPQARRR